MTNDQGSDPVTGLQRRFVMKGRFHVYIFQKNHTLVCIVQKQED